ncbi:hypothetical protein APY03_4047 [Variovorax sp. WDL1]|nr:hypothetical protein APY03_4047 [Variovorax sp. WDL1]
MRNLKKEKDEMRASRLIPLLLAVSCIAACAQRADPSARAAQMGTELRKRFGSADANVDGRLTREEAKGKMPWVYRNFDAIDSTRAGAVTMQQIESYALTQRSQRQK